MPMIEFETTETSTRGIAIDWQELIEKTRHISAFDAAAELGVSRLQLRLTQVPKYASLLKAEWPELVAAFQELGEVEMITRNPTATQSSRGIFDEVSFKGPVGLVLADSINLRLFSHHWVWGVAVHEPGEPGQADRAIEIYDKYGEPMLEVRIGEGSDQAAFDALVERFRSDDSRAFDLNSSTLNSFEFAEKEQAEAMTLDDVSPETRAEFAESWAGMTDPHDFFFLLRKYEFPRLLALELGRGSWTRQLPHTVYETLLEQVEAREIPVMVFVGSAGCVQIQVDKIERVAATEPLRHIRGARYEMYFDASRVVDAWVVKKPSPDGDVTAVEFFDENGEMAFQIFGDRHPGEPERSDWRELADELA
jgi:putative hemin transport protein